MSNVLVIGDSYVDPDFFDAETHWFYIGKEAPAYPCEHYKVLSLPALFDVEEYDKKLLDIFLFCDDIISDFGNIDYVIANTEYTILCGAAVRGHYAIAGRKLKDVAAFRNKFLMKSALVRGEGVETSRFIGGKLLAEKGLSAVSQVFAAGDYPLVVKAASQAGSRHVYVVKNTEELAPKLELLKSLGVDHLVEQFVDAPVIHIDGICRQGELIFVCGSRYIDDCFAWQHEKIAMSSALIDDPILQQKIVNFTRNTLHSLGAVDIVFHLEAFLQADNELVFLEIASRPGGAAIAPCINNIYGVNLLKENFNVDVQEPSVLKSSGFMDLDINQSGGWVVLALQETGFCEIVSVDGDPDLCDRVVWKKVTTAGTRFNEEYYEDPAVGMYVVHEANADEVVATIQEIKKRFSVKVKCLA